jgi:hypothetical protein
MEVEELIHQINETNGYSVEKQVLNYQERTIALWVKTPSNNHIVIPCEPSEQQKYPVEYMDEISLWSNYKTTLEELMRLKKENDKILCKPVVKMMEDGLVVGFLTETNQFIKFNNPGSIEEEDADDGLPQQNLSNSKQNPYEIEMAIDNSTSEDPERIRIVRNINLESSFFALYRATIKSLLEDIENKLVLDAGCGAGRFTESALKLNPAHIICVDISEAIDVHSENFEKIPKTSNISRAQASIDALPFQDNYQQMSYFSSSFA